MVKKVLVVGFLVVMIGAVIAGAVTLFAQHGESGACTGPGDRAQGADRQTGQGIGQRRGSETRESDASQGNGGLGQGLGRGQTSDAEPQGNGGLGQGLGRGRTSDAESQPEYSEWLSIEGTVVETTELVVETLSKDRVQVGLGPSHYRDAQGFVLAIGDHVRVSGYWEDDQFIAGQVENLETGEVITLRDPSGRPMWAGQGRNSNRS